MAQPLLQKNLTVATASSPTALKDSFFFSPVFRFFLRLALSVGLIILVISRIDLREAVEVFGSANLFRVVVSFLVLMALVFYSAYRWYFLLSEEAKKKVGYSVVLKMTWVGGALGMFLPGIVGIDGIKIAGVANTSGASHAFASVFVDRLLGIFSLGLFVLLGLMVYPEFQQPIVLALSFFFVILALLFLPVATSRFMRRETFRWSRLLLPKKIQRILFPVIFRVTREFRIYRGNPVKLLVGLLLAIGFQAVRIINVAIVCWAFDVSVPIGFLIVVIPLVLFLQLLPISISGIGVREASLVFFFGKIGIAAPVALAISAMIFIQGILVMTPAGLFLIKGRRHRGARNPENDEGMD